MTESIARYYDELALQHGPGYKSADASSQKSLEARWKVLLDIYPDGFDNPTLLDVGCGTGGLASAICCWVRKDAYCGIDISPKAIEQAKTRGLGLRFEIADVMDWNQVSDYVVLQGGFYKLPNTPEGWQRVEAMIRKMWELANVAVAFTAICEWPDSKDEYDGDELRINPIEMLQFCRTLTPHVTMRSDYLPGDVAFYMYRNPNA